MNKQELVRKVQDETGYSQKQIDAILKSLTSVITETLKAGDIVRLVGFGTFSTSRRSAREHRNPQTGETIKSDAKTVPVFKFGKEVKDSVKDI